MIEQITIVTFYYQKTYKVRTACGENIVDNISLQNVYVNGKPFEHYCGYDDNGKMLFTISCNVPCEVKYL